MTDIENLKLILRENDIPFFTDEELEYYLKEAQGDVKNAAYTLSLIHILIYILRKQES